MATSPAPSLQEQDKDALRAKALIVHERLLELFGDHPLLPRREPMHELISTMLSHRTTEANEALAFRRMWEHFGSWEAIRDADTRELAATIAPSNFAEAKAPNIQKTLRAIFAERGAADLEFLRDMPPEEALAWLVALPGVGIKTATLVLLFCFHQPVMPVDTHLHRVSGRLGLIGPRVTAEQAHKVLWSLLPPDAGFLFNFHINMLRHGQKICIWNTPRCERCPLTDVCDWYQTHRTATSAGNTGQPHEK
jgi:endonuclease-3